MSVSPTEKDDFNSAIKDAGYVKDDFEILEKEDSFPAQGIGPITGTVTITHKETGVARTYKAGYGTAWVVDFEKDLKLGRFAA